MSWTPVIWCLLRTILNHVFINFSLARVWDRGVVRREIVCIKEDDNNQSCIAT